MTPTTTEANVQVELEVQPGSLFGDAPVIVGDDVSESDLPQIAFRPEPENTF